MPEKEICPSCGGEYERMSQHWVMSSDCSHPEFPQEIKDVLVALSNTVGHIRWIQNEANPKYWISHQNMKSVVEFHKFMGVFSNSIIVGEYEIPGGNFVDSFPEKYDSKQIQLRFKPHPNTKYAIDNWSINNKNLAAKVLHHFKGAGGSKNFYKYSLGDKKSRRWWRDLLSPHISQIEFWNEYELAIHKGEMDSFIPPWPIGWWNKRYMD